MPNFTSEIDVDPSEFVDSCSRREIKELIEYLIQEEHLPKSILNMVKLGETKPSVLEDEFLVKMNNLSQKFHSIFIEDENTLETIFNKYL